MAPELYEEKYGTEVDIYAFGMCLLEMTSRGAPYNECSSTVEVLRERQERSLLLCLPSTMPGSCFPNGPVAQCATSEFCTAHS